MVECSSPWDHVKELFLELQHHQREISLLFLSIRAGGGSSPAAAVGPGRSLSVVQEITTCHCPIPELGVNPWLCAELIILPFQQVFIGPIQRCRQEETGL